MDDDRVEDLQDAADAAQAMKEEAVPAHIVERLVNGDEHPLKVWREYRGMTQETLGNTVEVGKSYISHIEAGSNSGSAKVLKRLAATLQVDVDDLVPEG